MSGADKPQLTQSECEQRIPHRAPMLLIDEVEAFTASRLVASKAFRADEFFFAGHYPGEPIVPGVILCEAAMQAGAILLSQFELSGLPVVTRMNDVRFRKIVRPGDTLRIEVELTERLANAFFLKAKADVDGTIALRFQFACTVAPAPGNLEPGSAAGGNNE